MNKGREYFVGTLLDSIRKSEPAMEAKDEMSEDEMNEIFVRQMKYKAGIIK